MTPEQVRKLLETAETAVDARVAIEAAAMLLPTVSQLLELWYAAQKVRADERTPGMAALQDALDDLEET